MKKPQLACHMKDLFLMTIFSTTHFIPPPSMTLLDIFSTFPPPLPRQVFHEDCIRDERKNKVVFQVFTLETCRCHKQIIKKIDAEQEKSAIKAK